MDEGFLQRVAWPIAASSSPRRPARRPVGCRQGFTPDAILAHPGWGETLYAKDVFPGARLVHCCEWFYNAQGADNGFDPEFPVSFDDLARIRSWNALHLLNLENCDAAISPTQWQKAQHPKAYLDKIVVAYEGIDTENLGPDRMPGSSCPAVWC